MWRGTCATQVIFSNTLFQYCVAFRIYFQLWNVLFFMKEINGDIQLDVFQEKSIYMANKIKIFCQ